MRPQRPSDEEDKFLCVCGHLADTSTLKKLPPVLQVEILFESERFFIASEIVFMVRNVNGSSEASGFEPHAVDHT